MIKKCSEIGAIKDALNIKTTSDSPPKSPNRSNRLYTVRKSVLYSGDRTNSKAKYPKFSILFNITY